jgi:hypothetical protein
MERKPGGDQCCNDYQEAKIAKAAVQPFEVRDLRLAGLLALLVLL